jgi:hypothetical protein
MPNHVENHLTIRGPREWVEALLAAVSGSELELNTALDFDSVIPYPDEFKQRDAERTRFEKEHPGDYRNMPKDGFNSGGYEWCCENWGTKWNAYDVVGMRRESGSSESAEAHIFFQTAWTPPLPVVRRLAEMFPMVELLLNYFERGAGYCGEFSAQRASDCDDGEERCREWTSNEYRGARGG